MIKINLLADRKQGKARSQTAGGGVRAESPAFFPSLVLVGILALGLAIAGGWWWLLKEQKTEWTEANVAADAELTRLESVRKRGEEFKEQKALLERKITLITELKKQQSVPVHILDQVSRNLPDFLWLESMSAAANQINISGRATTYNAVSNFYSNLTQSGYFRDVSLGRTYEVPEGVSFSLTCSFAAPESAPAAPPQG